MRSTAWNDAWASSHGLAHYRGRSVVDLRPRDAGGKREAVERLIARERPAGVAVLGDEMSDVDAFEAVVAARATGGITGVTIAVHGTSRPAPAELLALADLRLGGAHEVGRWLAALAAPARGRAGAEVASRERAEMAAAAPSATCSSGVGKSPKRIVSAGRRGQPAPQQRAVAQRRSVALRLAHVHVDDDPEVVERGERRVEHDEHSKDRERSRRPRRPRG